MFSESHKNLWLRYVEGDYSVYKQIFESYYDGLYGYGIKLCSDSTIVEDSIQDVFIYIWEKRKDLMHINSPNVYLFVSLRRKIIKRSNKYRKKKKIKDGDFFIEFGVEEIMINKEIRDEQKEELHKALNLLSNQQKEVLFLHYYNGMSYGEIEEILSINRQSVRNHMYRAISTLRSALNKNTLRLVV